MRTTQLLCVCYLFMASAANKCSGDSSCAGVEDVAGLLQHTVQVLDGPPASKQAIQKQGAAVASNNQLENEDDSSSKRSLLSPRTAEGAVDPCNALVEGISKLKRGRTCKGGFGGGFCKWKIFRQECVAKPATWFEPFVTNSTEVAEAQQACKDMPGCPFNGVSAGCPCPKTDATALPSVGSDPQCTTTSMSRRSARAATIAQPCPCGDDCAPTWTCIHAFHKSASKHVHGACSKVFDKIASVDEELCCSKLMGACQVWQSECFSRLTRAFTYFNRTSWPNGIGGSSAVQQLADAPPPMRRQLLAEQADEGLTMKQRSLMQSSRGQEDKKALDESLNDKCVE